MAAAAVAEVTAVRELHLEVLEAVAEEDWAFLP
jgi:hypothetical protein